MRMWIVPSSRRRKRVSGSAPLTVGWRGVPVLTGLLIILSSGCGDERAESPSPPSAVDDAAYEGLSREEIERQAESMTPAEAERLGIIDTTIRMEAPIHPDSIQHLEEGHILPFDTAPRQ